MLQSEKPEAQTSELDGLGSNPTFTTQHLSKTECKFCQPQFQHLKDGRTLDCCGHQ